MSDIPSRALASPIGALAKDDPALALLSSPAIQETLAASVAANTKKAYASDFADFRAWCENHELPFLPASPATLIVYLQSLVDLNLRTSTIERRLVSITKAHELQLHQSPASHPLVKQFKKGILRTRGRAKDGAEPLLWDDLQQILAEIPSNLPLPLRDRALLLCGWWGGFRVSELSAMQFPHLAFVPQGVEILVPRSKGDQEGEGAIVTLARQALLCPVGALETYIAHRGAGEGAMWQKRPLGDRAPITDEAIALRLRHWATKAGFDPSSFSPHSLRSGIATQLALWGAEERLIQRHLRHKNILQTRRYIRLADRWKDNALLSVAGKVK